MREQPVPDADPMRGILNEHARVQQSLCRPFLDAEMNDIALLGSSVARIDQREL